MIKKTFSSANESKPTVLHSETENSTKEDKCDDTFPVGGRFMLRGTTWRVVESSFADNTEMRRISGSNGDDTVMTLKALKEDMSQDGFCFLENDIAGKVMRENAEKKK